MKNRLILFSGAMVRAILAGKKTQTRRIVKPQPKHNVPGMYWARFGEAFHYPNVCPGIILQSPYGIEGIGLGVRETWARLDDGDCVYRATWPDAAHTSDPDPKWKPSIFMPRKACRIHLEITNIRIERLHNISHEDAIAEGIEEWAKGKTFDLREQQLSIAQLAYSYLWESINGPGSWDKNPWVWVIGFKQI